MLKTTNISDFVAQLNVELPPVERFWGLGDLTALRRDEDGRYYRANYERGILVYALVAKHRPQTFLEFGTGRGYGCLCAAWAMADNDIDGRVYTLDMVSPSETFAWAIDRGDGPRVEHLSRRQIWPQAAPADWLSRVCELTGFSGQVMRSWQGPPVELAFIDAGHGYKHVRHDFYSVLDVAADRFGILFDDYAPKPGFGVQRLIDQEVAPYSDASLIYTDRRWPGGERAALKAPGYGMVWVQSGAPSSAKSGAHLTESRRAFLRRYRRAEVWTALRRRLVLLLRTGGLLPNRRK